MSLSTCVCSAVFLFSLYSSLAYAHGCTKLPASKAFRGTCYFQYVHGRGFIKRNCPPGTRFSKVHCGCVRVSVIPSYGRGSSLSPTLRSIFSRAAASLSPQQTSRDEDDGGPSRGFDLGRSIRSRIYQILSRRRSYGDDYSGDNDDNEKDNDDRMGGGLFSFLRRSPRGYSKDDDTNDDADDNEKEDDDRRGSDLFSFLRKSARGYGHDDDTNDKDDNEKEEVDERGGSLLSFLRRSLSGGDRDDNDKNEKDDDDESRGYGPFSFLGRSGGGDDRENDNDKNEEADDDRRESLFSFLRRYTRGDSRDDDSDDKSESYGNKEENDDIDYYRRLRNKLVSNGYLEANDKDRNDDDDKADDDDDSVGSGTTSGKGDKYNWWNDGDSSVGASAKRGDSPITSGAKDSSYGEDREDDKDDKDEDHNDDNYITYGPAFSTKSLMTKGKKYHFEDILDSGLDDDDDDILDDFEGIFEDKFYGLFEYVDDILDDLFDDDFDDFFNDLFDDDGYDDVFSPKYAHYFKDDFIDEKYKDFDDFFENYSKMSSLDGDRIYDGDDKEDDDDKNAKSDDRFDDKDDDSDDNKKQLGIWSGLSKFDIHRNGYGDDRGGDAGERDRRLFDFTSTLKGDIKSTGSQSLGDIDSILERFYDN